MTEIPLNTNFQLTQALSQLSQAAPNSDVARQAIEVIVKQLEGNLISLNPTNSAQIKAALLPNTNLQGQLNNGQRYQVQVNTQPSPQLQFFSTGASSNVSTIPIPESLAQLLLKLPAQQLNQLISAALPQLKSTNVGLSPHALVTLAATLVEKNNQSLSLNFESLKLSLPLNLAATSLSANQTLALVAGDKVTVEVSAKGKDWQLNIVKLNQPDVTLAKAEHAKNADQVILSNRVPQALSHVLSVNTLDKPASITIQENRQSDKLLANGQPIQSLKLNLSTEQAAPLIKGLLGEQATRQTVELAIPLKTLISQLVQNNTQANQEILNKLLGLVPDKVSLQIKPSGEAALLIQHPKLVANLPLSAPQIDSLKPLKITGLDSLKIDHLLHKNNAETVKPTQVSNQVLLSTNEAGAKETKTPSGTTSDLVAPKVTGDKSPLPVSENNKPVEQIKSTANPLLDNKALLQLIENNPSIKSLITPQLLNDKTQQTELLQNLLRVSLPKAELASTVLNNINKILSDPANLKGFAEAGTQNWLKQISQELTQTLPQGKEQDASQIKQLLTAPMLSTSSVQLVAPPASQGLLSGLITLLQVSLAARLMRNQPSQAERIAQILPSLFNDSSKTASPANPVRTMQDFAQLEQRQQLMREIGRLLSEHQSNKLSNADKLLQGQETFYYNLPTAFGGVFKNIELLIKREEHKEKQAEQQIDSPQSWQLTLKLSVGELGELLSKARLRPDELEIDFYASNDGVLKQLMNFLPLLKRRLVSLGIEVTKSQCQLGKIPESLDQRSYHIFKAKA